MNNYDDVMRQLTDHGLLIPAGGLQLGTHRPVRLQVEGSGRDKPGWYWLKEWSPSAEKVLIVGSYGIWQGTDNGAQKITLPRDDQGAMTPEQREAMRAVWKEAAKAAALQRKQEAAAAANHARKAWAKYSLEGTSAYLTAKGVPGVGVRYSEGGAAVLPVIDASGNIHGLQFLRTAAQAKAARRPAKEFWPKGVAKQGHFHLLGHQPDWIILVAEGYATAASIHAATGLPVACAFDAGNLMPVAQALRGRYKRARILICADDDSWTDGNPGVTAASAAAMAVGGEWVKPAWPDEAERQEAQAANGHKWTDFNDLHAASGLAIVGSQLTSRLNELGWQSPAPRAATPDQGGRGGKLRPLQHLDDVLLRFSTVHGSAGAVFDRGDHVLVTEKDVRNICGRSDLYKAWMEHPERDIIRPHDVVFEPSNTDPAAYNLWAGWPTEPVQGNCEKLLELLAYMCSGERNSRDLYDWVLRWLAYPIQHPGAKMKSTIVVHGPQGTGKNQFFETIMAIYGTYGRVLDQDSLIDKHNDWASRKLFLIADEVVAQAHRFEVKNKLKTLITSDWLRINPKHVAAYDEENHVNLVFLSNELMPSVLEEDDRRHCVIWTPPKKPDEFYQQLIAERYSGGVEALHHYLLHLDLGSFHPGTHPPMTAAKQRLVDMAQDSPVEFVDALYRRDMSPLLPMPGLTTDWYRVYQRWCSTVGVKHASLKRFVNSLELRREMPTARKGYREGQIICHPKSTLLFQQEAPEGMIESDWLGEQIPAMRMRMQDYLGGNADGGAF